MSKKSYDVAVVGATGMVGQKMLEVLAKRNFPVGKLVPVASERSAGNKITFKDQKLEVKGIHPDVFEGIDIALFSAGGSTSKKWAPIAAEKGAIVIDNSSAWRMDPEVPLCVPEVNMSSAFNPPKNIIANPNCSTIQMVVALKPLHDAAKVKRVVVSTYQAISGAGMQAVESFNRQMSHFENPTPVLDEKLPEVLAGNLLMHWNPDQENGYQEEELKMVNETKKIFADDSIQISPTTVRVPVLTGHSESLTIETEKPLTAEQTRTLLMNAPGIVVMDDFTKSIYPQPLGLAGQDPVFVGRIREDVGHPGGIQMWVVSDNLLKGAALNAVQIAEGLIQS